MNRLTCDIAEFSPVNHEDRLVVHNENAGILIYGLYENVMEHASFLIHTDRQLLAKAYKNAGLYTEVYLVSQ